MTDVRSKRDGSWVVELATPLHSSAGRAVDEIRIRPLSIGQLVRWNSGEIPSILFLMSELTDVPEMLLRQITFPDVDRLMLVFASMMPPVIQQAMTQQTRPMATPAELMPPETHPEMRVNDQVDPRFPHVDGPVRRFPVPPVVPGHVTPVPPGQVQQPVDTTSIAQPPDVMKAV